MKAVVYLFFFFMLFPYIDFINIGSDTQPNTLLIGLFIAFGLKDKRVNTPIIILFILFLLSILCAVDSQLTTWTTIKNVVNYFSPFFFCFIIYNVFRRTKIKLPFFWFMAAMYFYMFVSFMQMYVITDFLTSFIGARGIMYAGRGVVSLTPEPAYYGTLMLFFGVFSLLYYNKKQNWHAIPNILFQLVFLAKTSTALGMFLLAIIAFGIIQLLKFNLKAISAFLIGIIILVASYETIMKQIEETRVGLMVQQVIEDPWLLALADESASVRITSSYAPFMVMKHNHFLPMGFGRFQAFVTRMLHEGHYRNLITSRTVLVRDKIGGGINMMCFHLGFLGLLFPLAIYLSFKRLLYRHEILLGMLVFMFLLFTQMQMLNAIIGVIIGTALYKSKELEDAQKATSLTDSP